MPTYQRSKTKHGHNAKQNQGHAGRDKNDEL